MSDGLTATLADHIERLHRDGFSIVHDAIVVASAQALHADIDRLERELGIGFGGNGFEGHATTRVYNLLALGSLYAQIPVHPVVLPLMHHLLGDGCLVSSVSAITIHPGEVAQPIHADDQVIPLAKPHAPLVCNSMWALTDFTEANGATRLVPGSHLRPNPDYGGSYETIAAEMPKGSVLIWDGALWHGGGANQTNTRRTGIAMNYCAGFVRQQENQQLGIPPEMVRGFSARLQELVGYGVYRGLIGQIEKQSPAQRLLDGAPYKVMWDREADAAARKARP